MKEVIRQLDCDEEQEIMTIALTNMTIGGKVIGPELASDFAYVLLSTLSGMGFKIVEGRCN